MFSWHYPETEITDTFKTIFKQLLLNKDKIIIAIILSPTYLLEAEQESIN